MPGYDPGTREYQDVCNRVVNEKPSYVTVKEFLASTREVYEEMQSLHKEARGEEVRYPDFEAALACMEQNKIPHGEEWHIRAVLEELAEENKQLKKQIFRRPQTLDLDLYERVTVLPVDDATKKQVIDIVFWALEACAPAKCEPCPSP